MAVPAGTVSNVDGVDEASQVSRPAQQVVRIGGIRWRQFGGNDEIARTTSALERTRLLFRACRIAWHDGRGDVLPQNRSHPRRRAAQVLVRRWLNLRELGVVRNAFGSV